MPKSVKVTTLDTIFSKCIREQYDWICAYKKCEKCHNQSFRNNPGGLHCSHFKGRRSRSGRWYPYNCAALCNKRHERMGESPHDHSKWFLKRLGIEGYADLILRVNGNIKYTPNDRWEMNRHYNAQLKYLTRQRSEGKIGYLPLVAWD